MTQLLSPDTFEFFARYLLAGYVVILVRSRFVAGLQPRAAELVFEAIILSLWVQVFSIALAGSAQFLGLTAWLDTQIEDGWRSGRLVLLLEILLLPVALGMLFGWSLTAGWKNALFRRLSVPIIHPVRTGYDFWFGAEPKPSVLILTFEDGTVISGYFGQNSLAASDPARRDIYLEYLYTQTEDGEWGEPKVKRSAIISLESVRSIEILEAEN